MVNLCHEVATQARSSLATPLGRPLRSPWLLIILAAYQAPMVTVKIASTGLSFGR